MLRYALIADADARYADIFATPCRYAYIDAVRTTPLTMLLILRRHAMLISLSCRHISDGVALLILMPAAAISLRHYCFDYYACHATLLRF